MRRHGRPPALKASIADPAATAFDLFGASVGVSGSTLIAGAYDGDAAYIFERGELGWPSTPTTTLPDPAASPGDGSGGSVAISEGTAVAGAGFTNAAYVYTRGSHGWSSTPATVLADPLPPPAFGFDDFGVSVAIDDRTIGVGSDGANANGAVYTYIERDHAWPTIPTSTVDDPGATTTSSDAFGQSVAVADGTAIGGAWLTLGNNIVGGVGAAYIFIP